MADTPPIAFVAARHAWAVRSDGTGLACAFSLQQAGTFDWGPKADRVATAGLEVRDATGGVLSNKQRIKPVSFAWGHPTGKSIVFIDAHEPDHLKKFAIGGPVSDITPLQGVTYTNVEYHPSGLGIAFAVEGKDINAVWLSSNTGTQPKRLIGSTKGTRFGALAFEPDGQTLLYAAMLSDGSSRLGRYFLTEGTADEGLWTGKGQILRFAGGTQGPGVAFDVGTGCEDRQAIYSALDKGAGKVLLPDATTPSTVLGRVAGTKFVVASGACNGPFDLWIADLSTEPVLLIKHVDQAAVRIPEPAPPPDMPEVGVSSRFF